MKAAAVLVAIAWILSGCASHPYANNVKMVGFSGDTKKGRTIGSVEGEDCQWAIFGYPLSEPPRLDKAMRELVRESNVRYVNKVSSVNEGFNIVLLRKNCIRVSGVGYR
ncbi:MAG: hypothetical protein AAF202_07515 [Pseudomonadota bacterium]